MKILIFTDNHWCVSSSVLRKRGKKYSYRLENQIESLNWLEDYAAKNGISRIVCMGDFFNKAELVDEEITALKEIKWNPGIFHEFIVGNHESGDHELKFTSTNALSLPGEFAIYSVPTKYVAGDVELCFLPYIIESDRLPIESYFGKKTMKRIIFSHNDLKGIQMGMIVSQAGFTIPDIEANCDLFLNGHIHSGSKITNKVINLGSLTGQNFGVNAFSYKHQIAILDTDTLDVKYIENPYALKFYKLDVNSLRDIMRLDKIGTNAVVSVKCQDTMLKLLNAKLDELKDRIIQARVTINKTVVKKDLDNELISDISVSYEDKFKECARATINNDSILEYELAELFK